MPWQIVGEPERLPGSPQSDELWRYRLKRGGQERLCDLHIPQTLIRSPGQIMPPEVSEAIRDGGASALRRILESVGEGESPRNVYVLPDGFGRD